ncbi:ATP-binding protein [Agrobacterium genomosp. 13]|uniref:ATPase n=1 Tax=Agrobacterium genomosp. 13 str. CFBP 6927 TaxID=1183428 RepID=A0ABM9VL97_9HYPH
MRSEAEFGEAMSKNLNASLLSKLRDASPKNFSPSDVVDPAKCADVDETVSSPMVLNVSPEYFDFGPFRLFPLERRLLKNGMPVQLGSRALDILVLLSEHAGGVVAKKRIVQTVWPGINVEESSLRVQVAKLRKALGEGQEGARYIANIAGRGYSLVTAVAKSSQPQPRLFNHISVQTLPRIVTPVGRAKDIARIKDLVSASGFVTVHGFGGIGKTTVAVAVAEELAQHFTDGLIFVDVGSSRTSDEMESSLALLLGSENRGLCRREAIYHALVGRQLLLVFDNCEHLLDATTDLLEEIRHRFPHLALLVTSRELLRAHGEHVYSLPPLELPADVHTVSAEEILRYPSAQLFMERAVATGYEPERTDKEARYVARICTKLDGLPHALELVASRLVVHGLEETDALCAAGLALSWHGRRTAVPRQQTLMSSLDWAYELLSETEKVVLRRASVFPGLFTLEDLYTVAVDETAVRQHDCIPAFSQLVAKSFIVGGCNGTFRTYQIVRAYAWGKLLEAMEVESVTERFQHNITQARDSSVPHRRTARFASAAAPQLYEFFDGRLNEIPGW